MLLKVSKTPEPKIKMTLVDQCQIPSLHASSQTYTRPGKSKKEKGERKKKKKEALKTNSPIYSTRYIASDTLATCHISLTS